MILDITQDPQWIAQREVLWQAERHSIAEGLTKKQLEDIRTFFFTGVPRKNSWLPPARMLESFPVFTVEGLAWCLQTYGVSENNDFPAGGPDYMVVQQLFCSRLSGVPGLGREEQFQLFKYVFGDTYDLGRKFPFMIGQEGIFRPIELHVNHLFSDAMSTCIWLRRANEEEPLWSNLLDFFTSLIPHVDVRVFEQEVTESNHVYIGGGAS